MAKHPKPNGGWKGQRGTRQERGYGREWDLIRPAIIARDKALCQVCKAAGRATPFEAVDHIKPKAEGGTDDPDNLRCVCGPCHNAKTTTEGHHGAGHRPRPAIGLDGWPIE